ncbi:MAG: glycoside hydrolase family 31 protein, partial [Candidatus Bipolaricaulota bacterium]
VPFVVSTGGYGLWLDGSWPSRWRFGVDADGTQAAPDVTIETEAEDLELIIIPGPAPLDAVARFARLTGTTRLPPRWAFGPYRWRDVVWDLAAFYDGTEATAPYNTMIVEDVLMMDALGIPCTMVAIDRPWGEGTFGYGAMVVDEERLPAFPEMLRWLSGRGIHPLLFLGPWVFDELRSEAVTRGFHVENTLFYPPGAELIDFSDPHAVSWWQERLAPLIDAGVEGFKLDRGEEKTPDGQLFRGVYDDGTPYREGHNAYPLWFAEAGAGAFAKAGREEWFNIVRATWTGSSASTAVWGGDTDPSFFGLRSAIIALQRCSAMNLPIWGSDTGGYNERPPREALGRWLAFSAFCPLMEVGPLANLAPWAWLEDGAVGAVGEEGYPEGTYYDREILAIWNLYANLHYDMMDVAYELARRCHEAGTAIVRPMALAYPEEATLRGAWTQYLYGPDLLVRPIWEEGTRSVEIRLPPGTWVDLWTGEEHAGPARVRVPTPLHVIPLFARAGSTLDLGDFGDRWATAQEEVSTPPDLGAIVERERWAR